jgi:hypothetical protein
MVRFAARLESPVRAGLLREIDNPADLQCDLRV